MRGTYGSRIAKRGRYEAWGYGSHQFSQGASGVNVHDRVQTEIPAYIGTGACTLYSSRLREDVLLRQPVRRSQTQLPQQRSEGLEKGRASRLLALTAAILILLTLCLPLRTMLLQNQTNRQLQAGIASEERLVKERQSRLTAATNSVNVRYEAARRGMIASASVATVELNVPAPGILYQEAQNRLNADSLAMIGN